MTHLACVQVRFRRLAVNQTVLLVLALCRALPFVCSLPGAKEPFRSCMGSGLLLLLLVGYVLPMSVLWAFEVYARRSFLRSPAANSLATKQD